MLVTKPGWMCTITLHSTWFHKGIKMELIEVEILLWSKRDGEEQYVEFKKEIFSDSIEWVCWQYAEVNNGHCIIYYGEEKVAEHKC